ncbi:MAG: hypothetical protein U1E86_28720 [Burkholderiaceae bacterium]
MNVPAQRLYQQLGFLTTEVKLFYHQATPAIAERRRGRAVHRPEVHAGEVLADDAEREQLRAEKIAITDARNGKPGTELPRVHPVQRSRPDREAEQREAEADQARDLQRGRC